MIAEATGDRTKITLAVISESCFFPQKKPTAESLADCMKSTHGDLQDTLKKASRTGLSKADIVSIAMMYAHFKHVSDQAEKNYKLDKDPVTRSWGKKAFSGFAGFANQVGL